MSVRTDKTLQPARVTALVDQVISSLAGRGEDFVWDTDPSRALCIAVLSPVVDDVPGLGRRARVPSQPTSIGFTVELDDAVIHTGSASVNLAVYYREYPTLEEQLAVTRADDTDDAQGEVRYRLKYKKIRVAAQGRLRVGAATVDVEELQAKLDEALQRARATATRSGSAWRKNQRVTFPRKALASQQSFEATFGSEEPAVPLWSARVSGAVVNITDARFLSLSLENISAMSDTSNAFFFDVSVSCDLEDGKFASRPFHLAAQDFRYSTVSWGQGKNCVLSVSAEGRRAETVAAPIYQQPRLVSRNESAPNCVARRLTGTDCESALAGVRDWLRAYLHDWETAVAPADSAARRTADRMLYQAEVERFELGIEALRSDPRLSRAFQLMNEVAAAQFSKAGYDNWRMFQLVFIVSMLPSLLGRENTNMPWSEEGRAIDILWFPTGGGKTEAFFGLILTALFYDRLRGKLRGPTAWLRYPLRMLSVQQLQRLVNFIAEAEDVRAKQPDLQVGDPFLVGFFAGQSNSPNDLTRANGASPIDRIARELGTAEGQRKYRLLQRCPYCGESGLHVEVSLNAIRLAHRCVTCGRAAPLVFSDAEVYRYAPAVIVGTVDRLARIGQTERFRQALGLVRFQCPDHGYSINRQCVEGRCTRKAKEFQVVEPVPDPLPTIMLQDELHLLKESLGTYDSHFETLLDTISRRVGCPMPSKRIAATATIEGFEQHVAQLYGPRPARRFPVKGQRLWESAYTVLAPDSEKARYYVGLLPLGRPPREVTQRIVEIALSAAESNWAADVSDGNNDYYDLVLAFANEKRTAADLGSGLSLATNLTVLTGDKTLDDVRGAIDRVLADVNLPFAERLKCIVATSIISHGVDLARLNTMAFVGFPGRAAEYIQASSRVGRERLGVVFTLYRQGNVLERSAYGHFLEYHERLYQLVEPIPVARFSRGAFHRTLSGMYSAILLNVVPITPQHVLAGKSLQRGSDAVAAYRDGSLGDEDISNILREAYGLDVFDLPADVRETYVEMINAACRSFRNQLSQRDDWSMPTRLRPEVVASLREVDEQVNIGVDPASIAQLGKLRR